MRLNTDEIRPERALCEKAESALADGHAFASGKDVSLVVTDFGIGSPVNDGVAAIKAFPPIALYSQ